MAKASLTLPDGTTVLVEGSVEEIQKIISFYRQQNDQLLLVKKERKCLESGGEDAKTNKQDTIGLAEIVNALKSSDEIESIEKNILDRISMVDRILVPLYIIHNKYNDKKILTSGEISKFLSQLGIIIHTANVSNTLSGSASKYVMADKVRVKGQPVRYRLSRRGLQYLRNVIKGKSDE